MGINACQEAASQPPSTLEFKKRSGRRQLDCTIIYRRNLERKSLFQRPYTNYKI